MTSYELAILATAMAYRVAREATSDAAEYYHALPTSVNTSTKSAAWDAWCDAQDSERYALIKLTSTITGTP